MTDETFFQGHLDHLRAVRAQNGRTGSLLQETR
ncbi:MAG: hypothetical protein H0X40_05070 [Chthoniobacterales bacterium]|nr:hypothetical protein [Chthoniobacterales bacterium]